MTPLAHASKKDEKVCAQPRRTPWLEIERLTITLPADMVAVVKGAVAGGDDASTSEVVREALRDWKLKRALQLQELAALKADIDKGLADLAEGRVKNFDAGRIVERGRKLLAGRSASA
jgi:antitoxin ParD1/3/4